ncbi:hypothetical protein AB0B30_09160 [Streptomyces narbonensis]|uniref:Uncharacterized protein n=1 Tax=Streptomyces narbonensis TaxID=67333 RepID=A0ABV3C8U1_9ACTN
MTFSEPERLFKLWSYTVSHKTLLLRSDTDLKLAPAPRIEIYVGHVDTMLVHSLLYGLEIRKATERETDEISERHQVENDPTATYLLTSRDKKGFLISGRPSWRKAVREIDDPTLFDFSQPWPPGPDVTWGDVD